MQCAAMIRSKSEGRREGSPRLRTLAADYLERYAVPKKRPKSVRDDRSLLDNIVLPKLGAKKVESIGGREIEAIHVAMKDRPCQANVYSLLSRCPISLSSGNGDPITPPKASSKEQKSDRWLSDDELRRLCAVLNEHSNERAANDILFQLLTGARLGEVLASRKEDFDLQRGVWTKPSHQTKQRRTEHLLPLSAQASTLIASIIETTDMLISRMILYVPQRRAPEHITNDRTNDDQPKGLRGNIKTLRELTTIKAAACAVANSHGQAADRALRLLSGMRSREVFRSS
jgi:integrase